MLFTVFIYCFVIAWNESTCSASVFLKQYQISKTCRWCITNAINLEKCYLGSHHGRVQADTFTVGYVLHAWPKNIFSGLTTAGVRLQVPSH